jgi:sugar phosphate isomerase/epimerase
MKLSQVAAQLYTVRDFIKEPKEIAESMKRVREIGYRAVQISAMGPIDEGELMTILDGEGLTVCATHEPGGTILDEPSNVAERLEKLGCRHTAYPYPGGIDLGSADEVKRFIGRLDEAGRVLREAGRVLSYHNHHVEFRRVGGRLIIDAIYGDTAPENLQGEIDTYWVQYGGGSPLAWCERLKGRLPLLHMKDYRITEENQPQWCEVGNGNLDWKRIVAAADAAGCEWFIVEQDTCPGDPFDSLKASYDHIKANLAE